MSDDQGVRWWIIANASGRGFLGFVGNVLLFAMVGAGIATAYLEYRPEDRPVEFRATGKAVRVEKDPLMVAARKQAVATLPRFRELVASKPGSVPTLKLALTWNGKTELIWIQFVGEKSGTFVGVLTSDPVSRGGYKRGSVVETLAVDIEDWMVTDGEIKYGGYSERVMLRASGDDRSIEALKAFRD